MYRSSGALLSAIGVLATACSAAPPAAGRGGETAQLKTENAMRPTDAPVNQRFASLDAYLAWLRLTQAPVDGSWYEEVRPGVFQLRTGNLRVLTPEGEATPAAQTFTREQLARQFGFSR